MAVLATSVLILALCSSALAQPKMNDTFTASGDVEVEFTSRTIRGTWSMARNQAKELGFEGENYPSPSQPTTDETILRYDLNLTYFIRGDARQPHCIVEPRNFNGMPKFWDWLESANHEGAVKIAFSGESYDIWGYTVAGVRFEFGKATAKKPKYLYFYRRKSVENSISYFFKQYSDKVPDPKVFGVPKVCMEN